MLDYGREQSFGLFQIHAKVWDDRAHELGYPNYKDTVEDNLAMARHIYDNQGWQPWTCYTNNMIAMR